MCLHFSAFAQGDLRVNIIAPQALLDTSITAITIRDFQSLLESAGVQAVTVNQKPAQVNILLPFVNDSIASLPTQFSSAAKFPYKHFPNDAYEWIQEKDKKGNFHLALSATSYQGVSFGLYGLLQEKLGFSFLHPKQTLIPRLNEWPLRENFHWKAEPLFDKKGFHLHTQHPIELTEQLLDENYPNALNDVKEYIDWLARNGQNYFEFCLLNSIQKNSWIHHAKAITNYVHQRGLLASVDLSLHMIQQKNFQLYSCPFQKKKQIVKNLKWITQAPWDFINMEFTTAEFIGGNRKKKEALRQFILQWMLQHSTAKLMGRKHVVKDEKEFGNQKSILWDSAAIALDKHRGVLSHTVMFYDMTEEKAPVYENENQRHMFRFLLEQHQQRETWYYPESAYWITFDNSIPMLLLPYLKSRLTDIDTCVRYQIPGHITFSSGWEWGYWLIDWSIARWSWQHTTNGIREIRYPEMYAQKILHKDLFPLFSHCLQLQQRYLKDSMLMEWMTAMTVIDEIKIKSLANQFHPRPRWNYAYIRNRAKAAELDTLKTRVVPLINEFGNKSMEWVRDARKKQQQINDTAGLNAEILDGIEITAMRAAHRANTLNYLIARRSAQLSKAKCEADTFLTHAANIRKHCLQIVQNRERRYRYPVALIARKRWDHTAYHFGYLYPVSNLHFWEREEQQALKNQYRPLFMNIWNIGRIIGLIK
jgi:hypothetical protein